MSKSQSKRETKATRRIFVAIDGSEGSGRAFDFAVRLAKDTGGALLIANASSDLTTKDIRTLSEIEDGLAESLCHQSNDVLDRARKHAQRCGIADVETRLAWGEPAKVLLEAAHATSADVLVIGRRGLSPMAGLLLGSVSQKLASNSDLPLLIIP